MITFLLVAILFTILLGYAWFRQALGWFFIAVLLLLAYAHETAQREQPATEHVSVMEPRHGAQMGRAQKSAARREAILAAALS